VVTTATIGLVQRMAPTPTTLTLTVAMPTLPTTIVQTGFLYVASQHLTQIFIRIKKNDKRN